MAAKLTKYTNDLAKAEVTATVQQIVQSNTVYLSIIIPVADLILIEPAWTKATVATVCSTIGGFTVELAVPAGV